MLSFTYNHPSALFGVVLMLGSFVVWSLKSRKRSPYPLPPGPPGEPLIGHFRLIPALNPEQKYIEWGKQYGSDILYLNVLGRPIIVINSVKVAHELLDKRGANYADRPRFVLFEVMGWGITLTFLRWGPQFKLHRKLLQQSFTPTACKPYRAIQQEEARRACRQILSQPKHWEDIARSFSSGIVMRIGFGVKIEHKDDPYIEMAIDADNATGNGGTPAGTIVDFFPFLRYFPAWLVGSPELQHARNSKFAIQRLHDAPWAATEPEIKAGKATEASFMKMHYERFFKNLEEGKKNEMTLADIKGAAGAISIAGGNTTWSTIVVCILYLILYPEVQKKVRDEIDTVTGGERLPTFDDRPSMTYLEYVIEETTRCVPLSPLGVPHAVLEDDVYEGMLIPKGSVVYANAQAMTHDEIVYTNPEVFNPDRYAPKEKGGLGEPLPEGPFGFGRRVCLGRHLALAGVYIFMSHLLATFELKPVIGPNGKEAPPKMKLTVGLSSKPESFNCSLVPRSEKVRSFYDDI
ncbi:related to cytochrome p450 [Phialocephala subalpina]|uniref:Related to cytochrome p450 n=1 Tax=Phialocephala subalpina TaxID=576137 RepID=A0A1L7WZP3_9HELO|nr:related to cytochrome p450 [Phialocephala subalpina]